jgi:hypothetical protein
MILLISLFVIIMAVVFYYYRNGSDIVVKHNETDEKHLLCDFCNEHFMCNETSLFVPSFPLEYFVDKSFFYLRKRNKVVGLLVYYEMIRPINYLYISILCIHRGYRRMGYAKLLIEALQRSNRVAKKPAIFCLDQMTYDGKLPTLPSPSFLLTQKEVVWIYVDEKWCTDHRFCMKSRFQTHSTLALKSFRGDKEGSFIYYQRLPLSFQKIQYVYSLEYATSTSQHARVVVDLPTFFEIPCIITIQKEDLCKENFTVNTFSKDLVYLHDPGTDKSRLSSILLRKNEKQMPPIFLPM